MSDKKLRPGKASSLDDSPAMDQIKQLFEALSRHFSTMAKANAAVAKPVSVGDRHVVPLCELSLAFGGVGGTGELQSDDVDDPPAGIGGGAVGAAKAKPIALLVLEGDKVRLEKMTE
jgi:uncharacterized spore protein YtfJ